MNIKDTSASQIELLSTIFKEHNIIAVGDPKQAIYVVGEEQA